MIDDKHTDERLSTLIHSLGEYGFIINIRAQPLHSERWYIE